MNLFIKKSNNNHNNCNKLTERIKLTSIRITVIIPVLEIQENTQFCG